MGWGPAIALTRIRRHVAGGYVVDVVALVVGLAAIAVSLVEYNLSDGARGLGPGSLPLIFGIVLAVSAVVSLVNRIMASRQPVSDLPVAEAEPDDDDGLAEMAIVEEAAPRPLHRGPLAVIVATIASILLASLIGLLPALCVLFFFILYVVEQRKLLWSAFVAAAVAGTAWLLFDVILGVPIPGVF